MHSARTRTFGLVIACGAFALGAAPAAASTFGEGLTATCGGTPNTPGFCNVDAEQVSGTGEQSNFAVENPTVKVALTRSGGFNCTAAQSAGPYHVQWWIASGRFNVNPDGSMPDGIKLADFGDLPLNRTVTRTFSSGPPR
jgi:hypothetical protein